MQEIGLNVGTLSQNFSTAKFSNLFTTNIFGYTVDAQ